VTPARGARELREDGADPAARTAADGGVAMLWALTILLLFLWVLGVATSSQLGLWIHVLLVLALVSLVANLVRGRRVI
jgi:hypothetical protein